MPRMTKRYVVLDRGTGVWYFKLAGWRSYKSTRIEIRRNRAGKPTNRHEAEQHAMEQADRAALLRGNAPTFREFLAPYYGPNCPHCARLASDNRPITEEYRAGQRHRIEEYVLKDPIADLRVFDVTPGAIEDWKQRTLSRVGRRTVNQTLAAMSGAFSEAVHRRELPYNPAKSVGSVGAPDDEEDNQYGIFTPEELRRLFVDEVECWGYAKGKTGKGKREGRDWRPARLFGLLIATIGERPSAILALNWQHYDGETLTFPKTKDRRKRGRVVPLTGIAVAALDEWKEESVRIGPGDPIFGYDGGGRMGKTWFRKRFWHAMHVLELPEEDAWGGRRVPYSFKYTLETELLDRGASPVLVRELMGHSHQRGEANTVLTPVQARYRRRRGAETLRELLPVIESIVGYGE